MRNEEVQSNDLLVEDENNVADNEDEEDDLYEIEDDDQGLMIFYLKNLSILINWQILPPL